MLGPLFCGLSKGKGMRVKRVVAMAIGGVILAAAGVALAANMTSSSSQSDYFAPGKHNFYVWCAHGADYRATSVGASAEDAQIRLYDKVKASGKTTCWPVWQGRVQS